VNPGDTLTFTWDQLHGVYSLGKFADLSSNSKTKPEPKCEDFKDFRDSKDFVSVEPRREGYYGPQHGSVSWVAPAEEGVYAFADPIEQNCWAGMLLVVDVEKPKMTPVAAPTPAPSKGKKNDHDDRNKKPASVVVPAAAPAPAPSTAAAVSVASVEQAPAQTAIEEGAATSFIQEPTEMTARERHAARVAEREAAREQRQMQRAIEEGRVDFESQQHVIED
jgi:hypothetical protein